VQNHYFVQFLSTNCTIEQNWWLFCRALLHLKDNYLFRIPKFWVLRVHANSDSEWENEKFEICKFKGLLKIPNFECYFELLSVQFTRPTSASDFFVKVLTTISVLVLMCVLKSSFMQNFSSLTHFWHFFKKISGIFMKPLSEFQKILNFSMQFHT
jgi:hypothetical protein